MCSELLHGDDLRSRQEFINEVPLGFTLGWAVFFLNGYLIPNNL